MAIDYYGSFPCEVREKVSDEELLALQKAKYRAETIREMKRSDPEEGGRNASEWTVNLIVNGPNGSTETTLHYSDLLAESAPLEELRVHCEGCPHKLWQRDFGCGGAIHYPISLKAERWLVSRLPDNLKERRGVLLVRAIEEFGFDGKVVENERGRGDLYESRLPISRLWGNRLFGRTSITSNQILAMIFRVGSLNATHAKLIAYFLGFVGDEFEPDDLSRNRPQEDDDKTISEMKAFFTIAARAGTAGAPVFIDA